MSLEIKEIEINKEVFEDGYEHNDLICWIVPDEDDPEDYNFDLLDNDMIENPIGGYFFIYYYDGQITHFFQEELLIENYIKHIDDPRYTPVEGTFNYYGDGLNMIDQPAHVIIKEVLKKRGYI